MKTQWCAGLLALAVAGCTGGGEATSPPDAPPFFAAVSAGGDHTCGIRAGGSVYCWGSNVYGQLGNGATESRTVPVRASGTIVFKAVSAGARHTCGLSDVGVAYCWGWNYFGQLGAGSTVGVQTPYAVVGDRRYDVMSAGWTHTCAVATGGAVYCWGANGEGQLGDSTRVDQLAPVAAAGGLRFASVSAGGFHSCGLTRDGAAYCWGANTWGQLGNGRVTGTSVPVAVSGGLRFRIISAGYSHTCAITLQGSGYCWGSSGSGELGNQVVEPEWNPGSAVPSPLLPGTPTLVSISAGMERTCAVATGGSGLCWGQGAEGELGTGLPDVRATPQPVRALDRARFAEVSARGNHHVCALTASGGAYCWGSGALGQLGSPGLALSLVPARVVLPEEP